MRNFLTRIMLPWITGDPPAPMSGEIWYDSSANKFRGYENGVRGDLITAAGGALTLTTVENDLGALPLYSGTFDITGLSGLSAGKAVSINQAAGPYTNKGDRQDEAEMDFLVVKGYVVNATTIRCYWNTDVASGPISGNVKFNYIVSA